MYDDKGIEKETNHNYYNIYHSLKTAIEQYIKKNMAKLE